MYITHLLLFLSLFVLLFPCSRFCEALSVDREPSKAETPLNGGDIKRPDREIPREEVGYGSTVSVAMVGYCLGTS